MISTLGRYLARLLLIRVALLLLGLSALLTILEFLADGDQVIADSGTVVWPVLRYSLLRLPEIWSDIIPIAAILSGLLTFTELARHSELTAIRAIGLSKLQLGVAIMPVALLIATVQFLVEDQALPRAVDELRVWGVADYDSDEEEGQGALTWLRQGDDIVRFRRVDAARGEVSGVTIFLRDPQGNFVEKIEAEGASYGPDGWSLQGVTVARADPLAGGGDPPAASMPWPIELDPALLALAGARPEETSLVDLLQLIARPDLGTQPAYRYQVWAHERIAGPATTVVLLLLTVTLARPFPNRVSRGLLLAAGIAIGFVCWTFDGLVLTFGDLGLLPPVLAAWMPLVILAAVALSILLHDERHRSGPSHGIVVDTVPVGSLDRHDAPATAAVRTALRASAKGRLKN